MIDAHVEREHQHAEHGDHREALQDVGPVQVDEHERAQRLHHVGDGVQRRRDLHRPREQVARHEVRRQEQQREEDQPAELVAAALRVLSAISCMKPTNTTDHSAVSSDEQHEAEHAAGDRDAEDQAEHDDRGRDQHALDELGDSRPSTIALRAIGAARSLSK